MTLECSFPLKKKKTVCTSYERIFLSSFSKLLSNICLNCFDCQCYTVALLTRSNQGVKIWTHQWCFLGIWKPQCINKEDSNFKSWERTWMQSPWPTSLPKHKWKGQSWTKSQNYRYDRQRHTFPPVLALCLRCHRFGNDRRHVAIALGCWCHRLYLDERWCPPQEASNRQTTWWIFKKKKHHFIIKSKPCSFLDKWMILRHFLLQDQDFCWSSNLPRQSAVST